MSKTMMLLGGAAVLGAGFLLLRSRSASAGAVSLGTAQVLGGAAAVAKGLLPPTPPPPPNAAQLAEQGRVSIGAQKVGQPASPSFAKQMIGLGGVVAELAYPGVGKKAANVLAAVDSKIGTGLVNKIPGVSKVTGTVTSGVKKLFSSLW